MKKLTAERCRKQIAEWERMMSVSDIAVMVERHLQAYRIALPILEQQERGAGEWIEWGGGLVPPVTGLVEVRYRNGREQKGCKAGDFSWSLGLGGLTIIAYRIIPQQPTNQNGEQ